MTVGEIGGESVSTTLSVGGSSITDVSILSRSLLIILPLSPEPLIVERSIFLSAAIFLANGDAKTRLSETVTSSLKISVSTTFSLEVPVIIFSFSFVISFYHFGIEQGFFEESAVCGLKNATEIISKEEILKQLQTKTVNCKDVTFRIFGFSLTTFNIFISLILVFILVKILKNYEKFKRKSRRIY